VSALPAISRIDPADTSTVRRLVDGQLAALAVDDPTCPPWSARILKLRLTIGLPVREPSELWWTPGDLAGGLAGGYCLQLPDLDNLDSAWLDLFVQPAARRRGLGTALLRHAMERVAANGRTRLVGNVIEGSGGEAFARHAGATIGLAELRRVLDLARVPAQQIAGCRARATVAAAGYSLATWLGPTPEEYLKGVVAMNNAMNDAPSMPHTEPEIWNEQRLRDRADGWIEAVGARP
jgi:GNAT superfamily N-acetyltransferase